MSSKAKQKIGFKDKNEREICAGDIFEINKTRYVVDWFWGTNSFGIYYLTDDKNFLITTRSLKELVNQEIIGNIYTSPEFLYRQGRIFEF